MSNKFRVSDCWWLMMALNGTTEIVQTYSALTL